MPGEFSQLVSDLAMAVREAVELACHSVIAPEIEGSSAFRTSASGMLVIHERDSEVEFACQPKLVVAQKG